MRKKNFVVLFAALLAVLGFSSCLNDDNGNRETVMLLKSSQTYAGAGFEFKDVSGCRYVPTAPINPTEYTKFAYVHFNYNQDDVHQGMQAINIELLDEPLFVHEGYYVPAVKEEAMKHNTLLSLRSAGIWKDKFDECLFLELACKVKKGTTTQTIKAEEQNHTFTLYLDPAKSDYKEDLNLVMVYEVHTDVEDSKLSDEYTVDYITSRFFDISEFVGYYQSNNDGKKPSKINVRFAKSGAASVVGENTTTEVVSSAYPQE